MKQQGDTSTSEIFPVPGRRGRKPTGNAKTGAERVAGYKQRKEGEIEAMRLELAELREKVRTLETDNAALAAELHRQTAPKMQTLGCLAGLAKFFDEVGIAHDIGKEAP